MITYRYTYQDKIFLLPDEESPYDEAFYDDDHLVWQNTEYADRWDDSKSKSESEYYKMLELDDIYNFTDYDNAPNFVHVMYQYTYRTKSKKSPEVLYDVKIYRRHTLVDEFYNT